MIINQIYPSAASMQPLALPFLVLLRGENAALLLSELATFPELVASCSTVLWSVSARGSATMTASLLYQLPLGGREGPPPLATSLHLVLLLLSVSLRTGSQVPRTPRDVESVVLDSVRWLLAEAHQTDHQGRKRRIRNR